MGFHFPEFRVASFFVDDSIQRMDERITTRNDTVTKQPNEIDRQVYRFGLAGKNNTHASVCMYGVKRSTDFFLLLILLAQLDYEVVVGSSQRPRINSAPELVES